MTAKELIAFLQAIPDETPIVTWVNEYDCGFPSKPEVVETLEWDYHLGGHTYEDHKPYGESYDYQVGLVRKVVRL